MMIWGIFMSATMKVAVHFRQDYQNNLHTSKNTDFDKFKQLFDVSQILNLDQSREIYGMSTTDWHSIL